MDVYVDWQDFQYPGQINLHYSIAQNATPGNRVLSIISPYGTANYFFFQVEVPVIRITRGGNDITDATSDVIVGQQIVLNAQVTGTYTAGTQTWNLGGTTVGGFVADNSQGYTTPLSLIQADITFYFVNSGTNVIATYSVTASGVIYSASTRFNIVKPLSSSGATFSASALGADAINVTTSLGFPAVEYRPQERVESRFRTVFNLPRVTLGHLSGYNW